METVTDFIFWGSEITADGDWRHEIEGCLLLGRKAVTDLDSILKIRDPANKGPSSQGYGFSSGYVWIWKLDYKESWALKTDAFQLWCWRKLLRVTWTARRSKPVHPKGNQHWIFIGRTDAEAETPILWPPVGKNWLIGKDLDAGKEWRREEKGTTEDEMVGWHHQLDGHEFE